MSVRRLIFSMLFSLTSAMVIQPNANYSCPEHRNNSVCCICVHCKNKCEFGCSNCTRSQYNISGISGNCSTCWGNTYCSLCCNRTVYNDTLLNYTDICPHVDKDNSHYLGEYVYYILASGVCLSIILGGILLIAKKPQPPPPVSDSDEEQTDIESVVDMDERFREFMGENNPNEKYKIHKTTTSPRNDTEGESSHCHQSREGNEDPPQRNSKLRKKKVIDVFYRIPSSMRDGSAVITIHQSLQETVGENGIGESTDDKPEGERQQTTVGKSKARLEDGDNLEQIKTEISQPKYKKRTRVDFERESHKQDDN